jgi:hypothetical protein
MQAPAPIIAAYQDADQWRGETMLRGNPSVGMALRGPAALSHACVRSLTPRSR